MDEFNRAIMTDLPRLFMEQGLSGVSALVKYLIHDIDKAHGWAAADYYH